MMGQSGRNDGLSNRACSVGEFLKGWRRKAGLVTLAMTCMLTVGWMRSLVLLEQLRITGWPNNRTICSISSEQCCLGWVRGVAEEPHSIDGSLFPSMDWTSFTNEPGLQAGPITALKEELFDWRYGYAGFCVGEMDSGAVFLCFIPYWLLVLPLTLLSAWLILGKPRRAKPAEAFRLVGCDESR